MCKYKIITAGIDGKEVFISFDRMTDEDDIIMAAIEQDLIDGCNIQDIEISLVEVPRKDLIHSMVTADDWDIETLVAISVQNEVNNFNSFTNEELKNNFKTFNDLDEQPYFENLSPDFNVVGEDIDNLWPKIQERIYQDVDAGDFTAIHELLSTLPIERLKGYLSED